MVLENFTPSDSSFATDTLPPNDIDAYADTNPPYSSTRESSYVLVSPPPNPIYINLKDMPRPFEAFGLLRARQALVTGIQNSAKGFSTILKRPVTQDEANAIAYHFAKGVRIESYGIPIGGVLGAAFALRSQKTLRFPFYSPFGKDGKPGFFSPEVFGPLRGQMARTTWQLLRLSAYLFVGTLGSTIFFGSYGVSVNWVGWARDPRLKELHELIKSRQRERQKREPVVRNAEDSAGPKVGTETYDMARQRRSVQEYGRRDRQRRESTEMDDASPTGGMASDESYEAPPSERFQTDAQAQSEHTKLQVEQPPASVQRGSPSSPSQGSDRRTGGAWDRLRSEAMVGTSGKAPPSTRKSSSDAFNFPSADADERSAKAEAQKEFDARIEREREGKDFDDRADGGGKWS